MSRIVCLHRTRQSEEYSIERLRSQLLRLAMAAVLVSSSLFGGGCVTTAECDDVVECPGSQACYDFECKERCDIEGAICGVEETCEPCEQDDPAGQIDHCPDRDRGARVCLNEDE